MWYVKNATINAYQVKGMRDERHTSIHLTKTCEDSQTLDEGMGGFTNARTNEREDKCDRLQREQKREREEVRELTNATVSSDHLKRRVVLAIALHNHKYGMCFGVGNIDIALTIDRHTNRRHQRWHLRCPPHAGALVGAPLVASYRAISSSGKYRPFVTSGRQAENTPRGIGNNNPTLQVNGDATR